MAITWNSKKSRTYSDEVSVTYRYNSGDISFSLTREAAEKVTNTGFVRVGYDKDCNRFYFKESSDNVGLKVSYVNNSKRGYVRVPANSIGLSSMGATLLEGKYDMVRNNSVLWELKRVSATNTDPAEGKSSK